MIYCYKLRGCSPELTLKWFYLFFVLYIGFLYTAGNFNGQGLFFAAATLLASFLFIWQIENHSLRLILLVTLLLRLGLAVIQTYTAVDIPGAGADSLKFERVGWQNAQFWLYGTGEGRISGAMIYSGLIGTFYVMFGRIPFIPQLLNIYISLVTIFVLFKTIFIVTDNQRASLTAALMFTLIPTLHFFSAVLLRETLLIFFVLLSFYLLIKWVKNDKLVYMAWAFLALVGAGLLHGVMILLVVVHLFFLCFYSPKEKRWRVVLWQFALAVFIGLGAVYLIGNYITYQLPSNLTDLITPDHIRAVVERKVVSRTSYLLDTVPYTYFDLFWQTPLRMIYFLFSPFPWAVESLSDLLGFLDVVILHFLIYFAVVGGKKLWSKNRMFVLSAFTFCLLLLTMFSWGTTNYGTAWRHRQKLTPYLVLLASVGVSESRRLRWLSFNGKSIDDQLILEKKKQLS